MISLRSAARSRVILIRPGATTFDEQGRMKGSLDMPLCERGREQVENLAEELAGIRLDAVYHAPCESAGETAAVLVEGRDLRPKMIDGFRNIDHGLWHGKLIDEIRRNQPRLYRSGAENPETVCPPGGESLDVAATRVMKAINRVLRKSRNQVVAFVIPDPMASLVAAHLNDEAMPDIWKVETDAGSWQLIEADC
ncbi:MULTISPECIES: histidine phosphatase family protein [Pirellulaceae]|uniref:Broad specificity phosphatase PhoE n=1 Tax=Aporhodopirellula rubra TaxID=980271 RepID=A0A7W5DZP3_9BACT|nr:MULTISPECIES: histidine phosphatase family protein [Pirellulaceae]MBB3207147.1 broad specificity phosphatase PhoE [Aporhodopirellula rubra]